MRIVAILRSAVRPIWTALAVVAFVVLAAITAKAEEKVIRIGYQKYGTLILLKAKGSLEAKLKPLGYRVTWAEFPAGRSWRRSTPARSTSARSARRPRSLPRP